MASYIVNCAGSCGTPLMRVELPRGASFDKDKYQGWCDKCAPKRPPPPPASPSARELRTQIDAVRTRVVTAGKVAPEDVAEMADIMKRLSEI